jgi:transcriptional regulator with XRE-family HTH domain
LAEFLRYQREETSPEAVGLHADGPRRTPGLRREEVSQLAGVGLSWYTWLEQGREITPSVSVLDALARVYDLDPPERDHLFHLAGVALPVSAGSYPTRAPQELSDIVSGLEPNPAYLMGPRTDVLAWNGAATRVFGEVSRAPDGVANVLWWMFTEPGRHGLGWSDAARSTLARFRAEHARRYGDPGFVALIRNLQAQSPRFRELWRRHEVLDAQVGTKAIEHPQLGPLSLHHLQSIPTSHPDLRLAQFVPADPTTRSTLALAYESASRPD